jgi:guanine deaminase
MIVTGHLLLEAPPRGVTLQPGWLRIEGGVITEIECGEIRGDADCGDAGTMVCPGFIDTHLHLPQIDAFGAHGLRLMEWLRGAIFPAEAAWSDPDHAERRCRSAIAQLHAAGTTGIFAFTSNHLESTRRCFKVCHQLGMHAILGQPLSDFDIPDALIQSTADNLRDARTLLEEWPASGDGRPSAAVAPRFAPTSSPALLDGCGSLAAEFDAFIATHLAENEPECGRALALHGGPDYTSIYHRSGLCTPKAFFGHCIHLGTNERSLLARTGSVAVHCPTSNAFLRSGTMNRALLLRDGVRCALGTDIAAGYDKSMIRTARAMLEVPMYVGEAPASASEAWWQITAGNASLLGWHERGRLENGAAADIVTIHPFHDWLSAMDPLGDVLWTWNDRWLSRTIVGGATVFLNKEDTRH